MHLRCLVPNTVEKTLMFQILYFNWVRGVARRMSRLNVLQERLVYCIFLRDELYNGMQ